MNHKISNVRFEQIKSDGENFNKVKASFLLDNKEASYLIYTKKDKNPISEAKKIFNSDMVTGKVFKSVNNIHSFKRPFIITASVLGAAVIALGGALIYKVVEDNNIFREYKNNPFKITNYLDGVLISEQTFTYNKDWLEVGSLTKTYNRRTGVLTGTTETKTEYDNKNRLIKREDVEKDSNGNVRSGSRLESTFETDNKGTEYVEYYIVDGGVKHIVNYSYDEYENTYTEQGKKQVNTGVDVVFNQNTWNLESRKVRQSEGIIGNKGYDSPSISSATRTNYAEDGKTVESIDIMSTKTERKWESETKESFKRLSKTKFGDGPEEVIFMTGWTEDDKANRTITEEYANYSDEAATTLINKHRNISVYDDLKRGIFNEAYELDLSVTEKEQWDLINMNARSYIGKFARPAVNFRVSIDKNNLGEYIVFSSLAQNTLDKYGRIVSSESTSIDPNGDKRVASTTTEYGDPIPINPDESQQNYYL